MTEHGCSDLGTTNTEFCGHLQQFNKRQTYAQRASPDGHGSHAV